MGRFHSLRLTIRRHGPPLAQSDNGLPFFAQPILKSLFAGYIYPLQKLFPSVRNPLRIANVYYNLGKVERDGVARNDQQIAIADVHKPSSSVESSRRN